MITPVSTTCAAQGCMQQLLKARQGAHLRVGDAIPHYSMAACTPADTGLLQRCNAQTVVWAGCHSRQTCKEDCVIALRVDQRNGLCVLQPRVRVRCAPTDTMLEALAHVIDTGCASFAHVIDTGCTHNLAHASFTLQAHVLPV